ncbi:hypothetical protein CEP54_000648 [Fusarium duplospermum]|uniref:Uncharacterized protein n=1 Tax=Fusarium duplospermum TaxID=1325734 RepID=A0A428R579_9HYPO|nr:hypothetical protein CEP54_000648 [Fusarium duplospermum]
MGTCWLGSCERWSRVDLEHATICWSDAFQTINPDCTARLSPQASIGISSFKAFQYPNFSFHVPSGPQDLSLLLLVKIWKTPDGPTPPVLDEA